MTARDGLRLPSLWWNLPKLLALVYFNELMLLGVLLLIVGFVTPGAATGLASGVVAISLGAVAIGMAALMVWGCWKLTRMSNKARWILAIVFGASAAGWGLDVLLLNNPSMLVMVLFNALAVYALIGNSKVRATFADEVARKRIADMWVHRSNAKSA